MTLTSGSPDTDLSEQSTAVDIHARLAAYVNSSPDRVAISFPGIGAPERAAAVDDLRYRTMTYGELGVRVRDYARGFAAIGIERGTKAIVMLRPDPDLYAVLFALFRIGAVPVVVDPGMGVRRMLHCFRSVGAQAFIGIPKAHLVRLLARGTFSTVRISVSTGRIGWDAHTLGAVARQGRKAVPTLPIAHRADDLLLIAFTTGSTGPAKGVEVTRAGLAASLRVVERLHDRHDGFRSLATVPLFGLFDLAQGAHIVLGPVDPIRVRDADPALLCEVIEHFAVSDLTASPALLGPLSVHVSERGTGLPTLLRVISMGAPAKLEALAALRAAMPSDGTVYTTYGSTEALPLTTLEWDELAGTRDATASGAGSCVGRAVPESDADYLVRLIRIHDDAIPVWSDDLLVAPGEVGEIVATGPQISGAYHADPAAVARAKIVEHRADGSVRLWHRVGDLARQDEHSRLWFCGRISQRVRTAGGDMYTVMIERIFDTHPALARSALVGVGRPGAQVPVLCYELRDGVDPAERDRIERELWRHGQQRDMTAKVRVFLWHPGFPVDIRHNAKIGREQLGHWAAGVLGYGTDGGER